MYATGDVVYVEGVVVAPSDGLTDHVHVRFPTASDPSHLLDGVTIVTPRAMIVRPAKYDLSKYTATEGWYAEHEH